MNEHSFLYGLIVLMVVFWSGNFIVGKLALREIPPFLLIGLRIGFAGFFMAPFYWWESRSAKRRWNLQDVPVLLILGVFGVTLNQVLFVYGLSRTSVAHSAIVVGLTPVLVLVIAAAVGLEPITRRKLGGMALALGGVIILKVFERVPPGGRGATWIGDGSIFLACLTFALFTVLGKSVTERLTTITVNTFAYVGGAVTLLPVTVWEASHYSLTHVSLQAWACVVYMALFPSVIAYLIYYHALAHISASRVSAFSYLQPLLATVMGIAILGEQVTTSLLVGGLVIFLGVCLAERG